jgi:hypothetical protein
MLAAASNIKPRRVGPYSRILTNGAGEGFDGRSREGKFVRRCEAELLSQIGREPTFGERLLVRRIARLSLQCELFDRKLASGADWTAHDSRSYSGVQGAIRHALRDLGLKPTPKAKAPSLSDYAKEKAAQRGGGA